MRRYPVLLAGTTLVVSIIAACAEDPSAPRSLEAAYARFTEPPPPPVSGASEGFVDPPPPPPAPPSCDFGWTATAVRYQYLRNPRESAALLRISASATPGAPAVSANAHINSTGTKTVGAGTIRYTLAGFQPDDVVEVFVDLHEDVIDSVIQPAGTTAFSVAVWGRLTELGGRVCRSLGVLPVELDVT